MTKNVAIQEFVSRWAGRGDEKQDTQKFWIELLSALGFKEPSQLIEFEKRVKLEGSTRFIDAYIPDTHVLIEQKSLGVDLSKAELQSGGDSLTPYKQARRYDDNLAVDEKARWIVCCNFGRFEIHNMNRPLDEPEVVLLENLEKEITKFSFLTDIKVKSIRREEEISFKAGKLVGEIYDLILPQYTDPTNSETLKSLNQLCVRLVFCLYAEDTGLFGEKDKFYKYLKDFNPGQFRKALIELFNVFDTPYEARDKYMDPALASFPYIKGGIFTENIEIPLFTEQIIDVLLNKASLEVDWSDISPTIFGAVFESTLNPTTRRSGGMHYTSIENIHKVIDPLFLDDLKAEFKQAAAIPVKSKRDKALTEFQNKLASLKFLDPACGSGNFLTETYLSLRRLENQVLRDLGVEGRLFSEEEYTPIKVKIDQFYGIEINDFAVSVARAALWIAESQTMKETEHIVQRSIDYFPLRENPNIVEGNALRIDWNEVVPKDQLNYIMGNPPFVGARNKSSIQAEDIQIVFGDNWKNWGELDYVCCWYKKSCDYIADTDIKCAFVSTNSVSQGSHVANLWKPLMESPYNVHIDFAWRTFVWDSEASIKAHVHCVIIGFSSFIRNTSKVIYSVESDPIIAQNISGYLIDSPNIAIENRPRPLSDVPLVGIGNKPVDGGNFLFTKDEMEAFISQEPKASKFFRAWYGAQEFINNKPRYCLWLGECSPSELRSMPKCLEVVEAVRNFRLSSTSSGTIKLADKPTRFHVENMPRGSYIVIPQVSSQRRKYIPMGYMDDSVLCSDKLRIMQDGTLYHFAVLESSPHMSWMRAICCRLKSDYSYTINDVYNNFPWPTPTDAQKVKIEKTAQAILDARNLYPDCSLADLYDELTMPIELRKAHQANDRAVMEAYGFDPSMTEEQIVAELLKMYQHLTSQK